MRTRTEPAAESIDVTFPARAEYVSIARLAAAAVATRQAFTYDEVEDLKIAVSEACNALIAAPKTLRSASLRLHVVREPDALVIRVEARGTALAWDMRANGDPRPFDERVLGMFLMRCLVDGVDIRHAGDLASIVLRVATRRQEGLDAGSPPPEQD